MTSYSFLAVPLGYLLGSISSAYIVGRLAGDLDMRTEGDGRISAAAVYRRLGLIPYSTVVLTDMGLGALSIFLARLLTDSLTIILLAGFAEVVGHNWSVFLRFKGGLGATAIGGVLASLVFWQFLFGLAVAGLVLLATRRPGLSTAVCIMVISSLLLILRMPTMLAIYPLVLLGLMFLKRAQVSRAVPA